MGSSLEKRLKQKAKKFWRDLNHDDLRACYEEDYAEPPEAIDLWIMVDVVLKELGVVAQKIREIFAEEYHPDVPRSWKKWKHAGLQEEHIKSIENRVLGLLIEDSKERGRE